MPRRKQDRPKRMKWEENANERAKDDDGNGEDVLSLGPSSKDRTSDDDDSTANPDEDDDETAAEGKDGKRKTRQDGAVRCGPRQDAEEEAEDDNQVDDNDKELAKAPDIDAAEMFTKEPLDIRSGDPDDVGGGGGGHRGAAAVGSSSMVTPSPPPPPPLSATSPSSLFHLPAALSSNVSRPPSSSSLFCTPSHTKDADGSDGGEDDGHDGSAEVLLTQDEFAEREGMRVADDDNDNDELEQDCPLDFSVKKSASALKCDSDRADKLGANNLRLLAAFGGSDGLDEEDDVPLDLSLSRKRPIVREELQPLAPTATSHAHSLHHHRNKAMRLENSGSAAKPSSPWTTQFPFRFSPSASPNSSVEIPMWNGGVKSCHSTPASSPSPSSSSSSVAAGAHPCHSHPASSDIPHPQHHHSHHHQQQQQQQQHHHSHQQHHHQPQPTPATPPSVHRSSSSSGSCGRHNAWQSHWLSRGAEQAKDVLKCVWCRKSFRSLEEMTNHMKEARHCGMHLHQSPVPPPLGPPGPPHRSMLLNNSGSGGGGPSPNNNGNGAAAAMASSSASAGSGAKNASHGGSGEEQPGNMLVKESIPMPRKLVRGQDVWLGKGAEQTKQILKCMWCGQSFKTLAEMTTHMQQTQHYTNIISQEQIISWKSPEDRCSNQAHVNAVLTCKVCDQAFSSLKELSNHMVKNSHYKEHILRSITENGGRRRQTREKRKKSLPVRKLLELERAQNEMNRGHQEEPTALAVGGKGLEGGGGAANGRITCEKCGRKIDTQSFVEHIRLCVGGGSGMAATGSRDAKSKSPPVAATALTPEARHGSRDNGSPPKRDGSTPSPLNMASHHPIPPIHPNGQLEAPEAPSVLNAIERLIEKSFESKRNRQVYVGGGGGSNSGTPVNASAATSTTPTPVPHSPIPLKKMVAVGSDGERSVTPAQHSKGAGGHLHGRHTPSSRDRKRRGSGERERRKNRGSPAGCERKSTKRCVESDDDGKRDDVSARGEEDDDEDATAASEGKCLKEECLSSPQSNYSGTKDGDAKATPDSVASVMVRLSPLSVSGLRREASPARSIHSPGSCSNSSHGTVASGRASVMNEAGGTLSLVCSSPSPTSPACGDHPLRELQKLLDKTNVSLCKGPSSSTSAILGAGTVSPSIGRGSHDGGSTATTAASSAAMVAFSWATCNDGLTSDSIVKCAFCDTPFISKGAYRHHLSKMHFIKDGAMPDLLSPVAVTTANNSTCLSVPSTSTIAATSSATLTAACPGNSNKITSSSALLTVCSNKSASNNSGSNSMMSTSASAATTTTMSTSASCKSPLRNVSAAVPTQDESPHSKFLKYTELAKQLSSKYV